MTLSYKRNSSPYSGLESILNHQASQTRLKYSFSLQVHVLILQTMAIATKGEPHWSELLAPAPMGIAVLSQLMICASQLKTDLPIIRPNDKSKENQENQLINQTKFSLIKYPNSFRTTMVQIVNEAYNAFIKAHANMEKIQLQVAQVPDYVKECVKLMQSDNKVAKKFLVRRLENIEKIAVNGENLSREVCDAFDLLGQLIQQVLEATTNSRGGIEQEIQAIINDKETRKKEIIERQRTYLKKEEDDARALLSKGKEYLIEEHNRNKGFWESILNSSGKKEKIAGFEKTAKDTEERLKRVIQDRAKAEKEINKICDECTKSLKNMHIAVKKDDSSNTDQRMINILEEGMNQLLKLQEQWGNMTLYFKSINNEIAEMKTKQNNFDKDVKDAQEDTSMIDFLMDSSMKKLLESSIESHRTAATYVKVSNNYILEPMRKMHGMMAIEPAKIKQAQGELINSCERASKGIKDMFNKDSAQTIRELENDLQSLDLMRRH